MSANPDWFNKLKSSKGIIPGPEHIKIINNFIREEIFNHSYDESIIFNHLYLNKVNENEMKAKRQPNPFMIFRVVLGLIATTNSIKLGDGTLQSKIAGFMWGGAEKSEKERFENLATKFKLLHKQMFPDYEYKPKQKPQTVGTVFETKTVEDFAYSSKIKSSTNNTFQNSLFNGIPTNQTFQPQLEPLPTFQNFQNSIFTGIPMPMDQTFQTQHLPFLMNQILYNDDFLQASQHTKPVSVPQNPQNALYQPSIAANVITSDSNQSLYDEEPMGHRLDSIDLYPFNQINQINQFTY
ncbi:hypothetical protein C1645_773919 [Glomus cerebriforme]|uniref:HMG box domain-containing protein n=1 Tax=Glomus cerebriforme TaxID=658196 RepID=A0A397SRL8_9GLOM|nr:hypothetical protein C1645_773919 [Glomus cerebriforme]